jgi:murein DD-endopeptidase MepM/ murein hydrolase activator NlpD
MVGLDQSFLSQLYGDSTALDSASRQAIHPGALSRTLPPSSPIPDGLPATGWISRGFSDVEGSKHTGIDLAIAEGTPVYATAFGEVTRAGWDDIYGFMVVLRNNDSIETIYGHNSRLLVNPGDTVFAGQELALSGNTGKSSAPHLHYEIRVHGKPTNPIKYFVYENRTN